MYLDANNLYLVSLEKLFEEKLPERYDFFSSLKMNLLVKPIIYILLIFGVRLK